MTPAQYILILQNFSTALNFFLMIVIGVFIIMAVTGVTAVNIIFVKDEVRELRNDIYELRTLLGGEKVEGRDDG